MKKVILIIIVMVFFVSCISKKERLCLQVIRVFPLVFSYNKPIKFEHWTDTMAKLVYKEYIIFQLPGARDLETDLIIAGSESYFIQREGFDKGVYFRNFKKYQKPEQYIVDSALRRYNLKFWRFDDSILSNSPTISFNKDEKNIEYVYRKSPLNDTIKATLNKNYLNYHQGQFPQLESFYNMGVKKVENIFHIDTTRFITSFTMSLVEFDNSKIPIYEKLIHIHDSIMQVKR